MSHPPVTEAPPDGRAPPETRHPARPRRAGRRLLLGLTATPVALGLVGLTIARSVTGPAVPITPVAPTAIGSLAASRAVAARGEVAEIYGNKFIVQDGTGRVLVETGPRGEDVRLVTTGETVTVQGRFEHGFLHAAAIMHPDGSQILLGPAGGPPPAGSGALAWMKDKVGLGPSLDVPVLTARVSQAGYSDVRVMGSGPRHLEVAAKSQDGRERRLHVDADGTVREN